MSEATAREIAEEILGACTCHAAWKDRGLTDHQCVWCNYGDEVGAALEAARGEEEYWKRACAGQADIAREQHAKADALREQVAALHDYVVVVVAAEEYTTYPNRYILESGRALLAGAAPEEPR